MPGGRALIDIYSPYHFMRAAGEQYEDGDRGEGRTVFDPEGSRLLDTIWRRDEKQDAIIQSLRCYSPADLRMLLDGPGLLLDAIEPYESENHERRDQLTEAPPLSREARFR